MISLSAKPHQCSYPGCHHTFTRKCNLQRHIKEVHGSPTYQCPIPDCKQMFKRKSDMNIHIRDTHSNTASYHCNYPGCSNSYKHRTSLQRHIREVHDSSTYQCPIPGCNKTFAWKDSLLEHLKYVHNFDESKRLPCPISGCEKSFKRKKDLKKHILYLHNDGRDIQSDVPQYKCPLPDCNKTYKHKSGLYEHIRFIHQGHRPHVCENCGKGFRQVQSLRYHLEHNLCWSTGRRRNQRKIMKEHNYAVSQLKNYLRETQNPKLISKEPVLKNKKRPDVIAHCSNNRHVGFDVTIGRKKSVNLRNQITEKFDRNYEKYCDIIYIVVISKVKNTLKTIQECNRNLAKPKEVRVVHWRAIVRDNPKYIKIFQQIEDKSVL